jgi:haloalkane dehalogenase
MNDDLLFDFTSREVEVPGGRLRVVDEGSGPVMLLSHGTPTWSFEWRHLLRAFCGTHRCVAPDHLGFGRSERPPGADYSPEGHAVRFRALVEALDLREVTLVVHDYGGPFALPVAFDTDRISRIVILNSFLWPLDDDPMARGAKLAGSAVGRWMYRWLNASLRLITPSAYGDRRKLTPEIHAQYLAPFEDKDSRVEVLWALARALLGSTGHYRRYAEQMPRLAHIPTLVVWGMADSAFPPRFLERWRQELPHAQTVALAQAGHWPHEEDPSAVIEAMRRWLEA